MKEPGTIKIEITNQRGQTLSFEADSVDLEWMPDEEGGLFSMPSSPFSPLKIPASFRIEGRIVRRPSSGIPITWVTKG